MKNNDLVVIETALKSEEEYDLGLDEEFYSRLHNKIMSSIEELPPPQRQSRLKKWMPKVPLWLRYTAWPVTRNAVAMISLTVGVMQIMKPQETLATQELIQTSVATPFDFAHSVLALGTGEVVADGAVESYLSKLKHEEFEKLIREL